MTAIRIALGFLCTLCVASAAETGNISAKPATVMVAKQSEARPVTGASWTRWSAKGLSADLALTRHTSSFQGPPGPTLAVGARFVRTPTPGLIRLDNFGEISEGEYVYDWPPGAKIVSAAPATPAVTPVASGPVQAARR